MTKDRSWYYLALASILFVWAAKPALAQTTEPILRLEVGTHNAGIWGIAIDPSNRILVTGSEDKTARVWDISGRGELLRTLRPPSGAGEEGQIFAVALSPDAGTVALGGRTGSLQQRDACVYLFDRTTGTLTRRLGGLPGYVQRWSISRCLDGKGRHAAVPPPGLCVCRGGLGLRGVVSLVGERSHRFSTGHRML